MKRLNNYIIEKLKINKDSKLNLSKDCEALLKLFSNYPDGMNALKKWMIDNNVTEYIVHYTSTNYPQIIKYTYKFNEFKLEESDFIESTFSDINKLCNKFFPADNNEENDFDKKYLIYSKDKFEIWGNEHCALLDTYYFEILIVITHE